jgi:hypothetical protein
MTKVRLNLGNGIKKCGRAEHEKLHRPRRARQLLSAAGCQSLIRRFQHKSWWFFGVLTELAVASGVSGSRQNRGELLNASP